jgi:hypothetical protein
MNAAELLEVVHALDMRVIARVRRLEAAIRLAKSGVSRREASGIIQRQFGVAQATAWRTVDVAFDLAGPMEDAQ